MSFYPNEPENNHPGAPVDPHPADAWTYAELAKGRRANTGRLRFPGPAGRTQTIDGVTYDVSQHNCDNPIASRRAW